MTKDELEKEYIIECPACNGTGKYRVVIDLVTIERAAQLKARKIAAKELREKGLSIREIMRQLNYRSPYSVQYLLEER